MSVNTYSYCTLGYSRFGGLIGSRWKTPAVQDNKYEDPTHHVSLSLCLSLCHTQTHTYTALRAPTHSWSSNRKQNYIHAVIRLFIYYEFRNHHHHHCHHHLSLFSAVAHCVFETFPVDTWSELSKFWCFPTFIFR